MKKFLAVCLAVGMLMVASKAWATRPFITDNASVIPGHALKLEPSFKYNKNTVKQKNNIGFGITNWLEASGSFAWGRTIKDNVVNHWGLIGPTLKLKGLIAAPVVDGMPGLAVAIGTKMPYASDKSMESAIWMQYAYVATTAKVLGGDLQIHANAGALMKEPRSMDDIHTVELWGVGAQYKLIGGLNVIGEVFSGNRQTGNEGGAWQAGLRYLFNDAVALDTTVGRGLWSRNGMAKEPLWIGCGLRIVTAQLW